MDKQYVVGVDFGHGETAAWIVPLVKGTSIEDSGESLVLKKANKDNKDSKKNVKKEYQNAKKIKKEENNKKALDKLDNIYAEEDFSIRLE